MLLVLVGILILVLVLVNLTPVQNFVARKAVETLAQKLETKVTVDHVRIDFLNHVLIQGLYIEDKAGDTLLYAGEARVRITDWFLFRKETPVIHYVGLHNAYGHLYRTRASDEWNYQFVIDAFDTGVKDSTKKQNEFELDLEQLDLQNVRFHMDDAWTGSDHDIDIGKAEINANEIDLKKRVIDIKTIALSKVFVGLKDYEGGRPPRPRKARVIDTTAFNSGMWLVKIKEMRLEDSRFKNDVAERPVHPHEFDGAHMDVTDINVLASNINIVGDTLTGKMEHMSANERCGFVLKKLSADVSVSPNATICKNLYLETNNSKLHHYYAMHYERFPDFTDYIHKVRMVADVSSASVDSRDVAYFAPVLRKWPTIVRMSGNVEGTVDDLKGKNLYLTDGTTSLKGNLAMEGLPNIHTTFIQFEQGEIFTTSSTILKYAPELRNNPNIAIEKLTYAHFKGNFVGFIENFAANGFVNTNLGNIHSDIELRIPDFNSKVAVYRGTVATQGFDLGTLIRQPLLGNIGFRAGVSGIAFDPKNATLRTNAVLTHFDVNGYRYKNINAEGTLEQKKFDGKLIVDDPNLALAFNGNIDFSQQDLNINATANVLKSDLRALNLTKDSVTIAADFDLNFVGSNIDNFSGYAKLFNINLTRESKRIDIDSVYAHSSYENGDKLLVVESNDLVARIRGQYQLSSLPYSVQYYLSGYLPNYIKAPTKYAPNQNFSFDVTTKQVDSLWAVLAPVITGFNNSTVTGTINTDPAAPSLTLNAVVPYGAINTVSLNNVNVTGQGNFRTLKLDAHVEKMVVGRNILSASMDIDAEIGNDSLNFNIATKSPDAVGTATIKGDAHASGDSLYMSLRPSEFYLNQTQWQIPSGNYMVFSKNFLLIRDLTLRSGAQQVDAYTEDELSTQALRINVKNLDLATLGNIAGFSSYQPDGRINGQIQLSHLFNGLQVGADVRATDVRLGTDTIGAVNVVGNYNAAKKIITLDPQSGIYRGDASIRTSGSMSFDSTNNQLLNGYIQFTDAELRWVSPWVAGVVSNVDGTLNGTVNIGGSAVHPDISGAVDLNNGTMKVDIIGTTYTIPSARINVSNTSIALGSVTLVDRLNNTARLTGNIAHDRLKDFRLSLNIESPEFEVMNLKDYENSTFYGDLIANVEQLSISGPFDNITMRLTASPVEKSNIYIPVKSSTDVNTYSYVSFKEYGEEQIVQTKKRNKFNLSITAKMNPLAEMTLVLDPATGDQIRATGYGTIYLDVPSDDDIGIRGKYEMDQGSYVFTLQQLAFRRFFTISAGSSIDFQGNLANTNLDIKGVYTRKARLYDLLNADEKASLGAESKADIEEAKRSQDVNILLKMTGPLNDPKLGFNIDLAERRSETNPAYVRLKRINEDDRQLFDQVAALLLVGTFILPEGWSSSTALTGGINNISEMISSTASSQLTNIVNKVLGDPDLQIDLKYKNYNLSDPNLSGGGINRNEISLGFRKNLFNDRLVLEVGNYYDWGRPTTSSNSSASNLNLAGDFRVQYLLTEDGRVRLNAFRTNNYDVLLDRAIWRGGIGIAYRRSFNNLKEFFKTPKTSLDLLKEADSSNTPDTATSPSTAGASN